MTEMNVCIEKPLFKSSFSEHEIKDYQETVKEAMDVLNKKNMALIIHAPSFPSIEEEDTGIGTIYSNGAKQFINFISSLGFNSIQLGPDGSTKETDASPYIGTIFSTNILFIDLFELTTDKWAKLLSHKAVKELVDNNPYKNKNKIAYNYIFKAQKEILFKAYEHFTQKLEDKKLDKKYKKIVKDLEKRFKKFKKHNDSWLDKDAIYEALSKKHNNDYWPAWTDELDKTLFTSENIGTKAAKNRIEEITEKYNTEIEFYKFCQFIANEQKEETKAYTLNKNLKTMADIQVAFSDRDHWAYQAIFMPGYYLGCPPDMFSKDGQAWGFPVLDPEKLYTENGSLGESGKLLKMRFDKVFTENPGGARIDHAVGLIDPWVYQIGKTARPDDGGSRLYSSPDNEAFKKYSRIKIQDIHKYGELDEPEFKQEDPNSLISPENELRVNLESLKDKKTIDKYAEVVDIILKSAKSHKVGKNFIIFEDLGTITNPVKMVMKERGLSGIRVTQFNDAEKPDHMYRGKNIDKQHWITASTHDNSPLAVFTKTLFDSQKAHPHICQLAEDLIPEERANERGQFIDRLHQDRQAFVKAKLVELFVSRAENVQIFFNDLFGMDELYNVPGTSGSENWSLRVPNNYVDLYFNQVNSNYGFNIPEILKLAIESKGNKFMDDVKKSHPDLLAKLDTYIEKFTK